MNGKENYLWNTEEDAYEFMKHHMMKHGVTDLGGYRLYELTVTDVTDGEAAMGFSEASDLLEAEEMEAPAETLEQGDEI